MELLEHDVSRILVSILCGSIMGIEREYRNKSAGFRTIILICLGSTIFTIVSQRIGNNDDRIAANIITGIGFIGAGVIFKDEFGVRGLTTAAVIWASAAIGMVAGIAEFYLAFFLTLIVLIVLSVLSRLEEVIDNINQRVKYNITFVDTDPENLRKVEELISQHKLKTKLKQVSKRNHRLVVSLDVSGHKKRMAALNEELVTLQFIDQL